MFIGNTTSAGGRMKAANDQTTNGTNRKGPSA